MQSSASGSTGSTKGFLSNNSQSIIENSKGPSLSERIHTNLFYLATNIHRYKGFNTKWITFSALFKMVQNYDLFIMPNTTGFWGRDKHAEIIMRIFTFPLHLCFAPSNATYHAIFAILYSLFLIFSIILTFVFLLRDPAEVSFTNREIYLISFIYAVVVPMFSTFTLSNFGAVLNHLVFMGHGGPLPTLGIVFAAIGTLLMVPLNLLSMAFIRARPPIDMKTFNATWGSRTHIYFLIDTLFNFVAFLEEFLPLDRKYYLIGYCCVLIALCNPITVIIALFDGTFQKFTDAIYFCTQICCTMLGVLLMLLHMWIDKLTPPWFLVRSMKN
ncbi:hypothetical protein TVAG_017900 [Trichomonas vaginalis G3]|uniref:Uncharacterized protein n=1 Tax=Trichomonas vaginalis (strain ATCC PRA-98 / G3) TaxID=412133 RepID=A2FES9_TRIV3|nr:hypothetical protein TVAGG3_0931990 [Trichomonas vaginalis G3]EAX96576.1 hypothetical protein TVAG_017900 [Trichomonas vaginalis G3]KAI5485902.1 hypothetical protein TVAGG3_0931990 [Trichomonas vaginalis G3]|eukprot:XP_001309506.1 hypothetical protein [Trichomonas vaginalis G3]